MSKAVLVIDMPKSCDECSVICEQYYSALFKTENFNNSMKPSDCPLREVPKKKTEIEMDVSHSESVDMGYRQGYNTCIDEILKVGDK